MMVLCHELGDVRQVPFLGSAKTAALKLESSLPSNVREQIRGVADAIHIRLQTATPLDGQSPVYQQLLGAIADRHSVRIEYDSFFDRDLIRTRVSPYRLLFTRHSWYVIGRSTIHKSVRTFNVARIKRLERTDDRYEIPRNFSLDRYLGNAWHLVPEPGPAAEVRIRFAKKVAKNVAEVAWHKTQRLIWNDDDTLDFCVTVKGLNEISWWVLGYGDEAEVLEPPALRKMIADQVRRMAKRYAGIKPT
jgi:proteasome accessory factor B